MSIRYEVDRIMPELAHFAGAARDVTDFFSATNCLIQKIIGWDYASWSTMDPGTALGTNTTLFGVKFDPRVRTKLIELEFAGKDVNLFSDLVQAKQPVASFYLTTGGQPSGSRRYRELLRQIDCGDELRSVFKMGNFAWGVLVAYRTLGSRIFSEADIDLMTQLNHIVAEGIRQCLLRTAAEAPESLPDGPGLVLFSDNGQIIEATPMAERWLSMIGASENWSSAVHFAAFKARNDRSMIHLPVRTQTGKWILLHASITGNGTTAIIIEEARGAYLNDVISDLYGLTMRERVITGYILQGHSTKGICQSLGISHYTVQDHMKSIFAKIGVRSRLELASVFFYQHYAEKLQIGSTPSPYGWYLNDGQ